MSTFRQTINWQEGISRYQNLIRFYTRVLKAIDETIEEQPLTGPQDGRSARFMGYYITKRHISRAGHFIHIFSVSSTHGHSPSGTLFELAIFPDLPTPPYLYRMLHPLPPEDNLHVRAILEVIGLERDVTPYEGIALYDDDVKVDFHNHFWLPPLPKRAHPSTSL